MGTRAGKSRGDKDQEVLGCQEREVHGDKGREVLGATGDVHGEKAGSPGCPERPRTSRAFQAEDFKRPLRPRTSRAFQVQDFERP
jgi:hypothetical protein